jgi:hypothetical protein
MPFEGGGRGSISKLLTMLRPRLEAGSAPTRAAALPDQTTLRAQTGQLTFVGLVAAIHQQLDVVLLLR